MANRNAGQHRLKPHGKQRPSSSIETAQRMGYASGSNSPSSSVADTFYGACYANAGESSFVHRNRPHQLPHLRAHSRTPRFFVSLPRRKHALCYAAGGIIDLFAADQALEAWMAKGGAVQVQARPSGYPAGLNTRRPYMTKRDAFALLLVLSFCTACVLSKFNNQFVYDDVKVIGGSLIHDPSRILEVFTSHALVAQDNATPLSMDTYRPLSLLTFFWDAWLSGHEPWSYHLTNHLIHLSAIAALYALARALLPLASSLSIGAACLFFGLSPQLAEAHVWINGRSDPLAALFGLLSLWSWVRSESSASSNRLWLTGAGVTFFLGLLCKEVLLFGAASLLIFPRASDKPLRQQALRLTPFIVASLTYLGLRAWALDGLRAGGHEQVSIALQNVPVIWTDGLRELLMPSRLYLRSMREEYSLLSGADRAGAIAIALMIAAALLCVRRRVPLMTWGVTWFACTLGPAAMISTMIWPGFGRYLYLPCAGIALGLAEFVDMARQGLERRVYKQPRQGVLLRLFTGAVIACYLLALAAQLTSLTRDYKDNKTLYAGAILHAPKPAYAYAWLGMTLLNQGEPSLGIAMLSRAVDLDPNEAFYSNQLLRAYRSTGQVSLAVSVARKNIARRPKEAGNLRAFVVEMLADSDPEGSVQELCQCLTYQHDFPDCLAATKWMLNPRGRNYPRFRDALDSFSTRCPSPDAQRGVASKLTSAADSSR